MKIKEDKNACSSFCDGKPKLKGGIHRNGPFPTQGGSLVQHHETPRRKTPERMTRKMNLDARGSVVHFIPMAAPPGNPRKALTVEVDGIRRECESASQMIREKQRAAHESFHRQICSHGNSIVSSRATSPTLAAHTMHRKHFKEDPTNQSHFSFAQEESVCNEMKTITTSKRKLSPSCVSSRNQENILRRSSTSPGKRTNEARSRPSRDNPLLPRSKNEQNQTENSTGSGYRREKRCVGPCYNQWTLSGSALPQKGTAQLERSDSTHSNKRGANSPRSTISLAWDSPDISKPRTPRTTSPAKQQSRDFVNPSTIQLKNRNGLLWGTSCNQHSENLNGGSNILAWW